jgi:hypothetical protein
MFALFALVYSAAACGPYGQVLEARSDSGARHAVVDIGEVRLKEGPLAKAVVVDTALDNVRELVFVGEDLLLVGSGPSGGTVELYPVKGSVRTWTVEGFITDVVVHDHDVTISAWINGRQNTKIVSLAPAG